MKKLLLSFVLLTASMMCFAQSYSSDLVIQANRGDADAQNLLGTAYYKGNGIAKDYKKAIEWWTKSAEQGNSTAMYNLGNAYHNGLGVNRDDLKAILWCEKAEKNGVKLAVFALADLYDELGKKEIAYTYFLSYYDYITEMIKKNKGKGLSPYQIRSLIVTQVKLGEYRLYDYAGKGTDIDGAISILKDAEKNNAEIAYILLAEAYRMKGDSIHAFEQIDIASNKTNLAAIKLILAQYYIRGIGCQKNYNKAQELIEPLARKGEANAQRDLGILFYKYKKNYMNAYEWLTKSSEQGNNGAKAYLGEMFYNGDYVMKDFDKAYIILKEASESLDRPSPHAMRLLSACYRYGLGTTIDNEKAEYWLKEAANHKDEKAMAIMSEE